MIFYILGYHPFHNHIFLHSTEALCRSLSLSLSLSLPSSHLQYHTLYPYICSNIMQTIIPLPSPIYIIVVSTIISHHTKRCLLQNNQGLITERSIITLQVCMRLDTVEIYRISVINISAYSIKIDEYL